MGAVGDYDLGTGIVATGHMVLPHQHQAGKLTVGSCARQEGVKLHSGNGRQRSVKAVYHGLRALYGLGRL